MVSFGEKAKMKKAGNLNLGRSYVLTTVHKTLFFTIVVIDFEPKGWFCRMCESVQQKCSHTTDTIPMIDQRETF